MKLVHEGVRGATPKLKQYLDALDITNGDTVLKFSAEFAKFAILHHEHAAHEDKVIFREFERYFPDHAKEYLDDHEADRVFLADVEDRIKVLLDSNGEGAQDEAIAALDFLRNKIPPFLDHFAAHLDGEEANMNPIGRKHIPLAVQKALVKRVWDLTPAKSWAVIIPYVLENLPRLPMRTKFVKALLWGLGGERAQQVGGIIYQTCDAVMWEVLVEEVPEIIPRGVPGWRRYY
jgi:hemerythrin-like domain-containing protein